MKVNPYHPQIVQQLEEGDFNQQLNFCQWLLQNNELPSQILFTDEATFNRHGINNKSNTHVWSYVHPYETNFQHRFSLNVWCGIIDHVVIGPHIFNSNAYLNFFKNELPIRLEDIPLRTRTGMYYQHDDAPAHFHGLVQHLNEEFPNRWIGQGGPQTWPARSPDMNPLDFFLWGHMTALVYEQKSVNATELLQNITLAVHFNNLVNNSLC